jgi:hypothetical protein
MRDEARRLELLAWALCRTMRSARFTSTPGRQGGPEVVPSFWQQGGPIGLASDSAGYRVATKADPVPVNHVMATAVRRRPRFRLNG